MDFRSLAFLHVIEDAQTNTENHVDHSENYGQLHFHRVGEDDLVLGVLQTKYFNLQKNNLLGKASLTSQTGSTPNGYGVP